MTERLYYHDSYLTEFTAHVTNTDPSGTRIILDRTAFYPTSGGQPFDMGLLDGVPILDVIDEDTHIVHVLSAPLTSSDVQGRIDWTRRFDHMQQHTGQHLLSAVVAELFGAPTVSVHFGPASATIDFGVPALDASQLRAAERRANEIAAENRPVSVSFEDSAQASGLRKTPDRQGLLRIVTIDQLDRSACGGTHVRATGEIGPILLRGVEKVRGNLRIEFVCGLRAVARARADYEALSAIARAFSAAIDETPQLVAGLQQRAAESDRAQRKLSAELAAQRGRELYRQTTPDSSGVRKLVRRAEAIAEDHRAEAQAFASGSKAALLIVAHHPPAVLVAASLDSGLHAGQWLKAALSTSGGRGGGSAALAQGSLPSREALETIASAFESYCK